MKEEGAMKRRGRGVLGEAPGKNTSERNKKDCTKILLNNTHLASQLDGPMQKGNSPNITIIDIGKAVDPRRPSAHGGRGWDKIRLFGSDTA